MKSIIHENSNRYFRGFYYRFADYTISTTANAQSSPVYYDPAAILEPIMEEIRGEAERQMRKNETDIK